jgi:hypothetical protein
MADDQLVPELALPKLNFLHYDERDQIFGPDTPPGWPRHTETFVQQSGPVGSWALLDCPNRLAGRYDPSIPDALVKATIKIELSYYPLYVGIDSFTLQPVFAHVPGSMGSNLNPPDTASFRYITIPDMQDCAEDRVVLHEYFFTDEGFEFTKKVVTGHKQTLDNICLGRLYQAIWSQVTRFRRGDPIEPLQDPQHRDGPPEYTFEQLYPDHESPYSLRLPCLTRAVITPKLFEVAMEIQQALLEDNIHLNEIIMAIFVWCNHEKHAERLTEGYIVHGKDREHDYARRQNMLDFVAIWPHYLRFHEMHKLSAYIHPLRFVKAASGTVRGTRVQPPFRAAITHRWEQIALREVPLSGLDDTNDWQPVVPCFLYGSLLKRPPRPKWYPMPLQELWETLALPGINMIGHPAYPVSQSLTTRIITPLPWNNSVVDRSTYWEEAKDSIIFTRKTMPYQDVTGTHDSSDFIRLISGDRLPVAAPPRPLEPTGDLSVCEVAEGETKEDGELHPAKILKGLSPTEESAWRKKAFETRISMAREAGITIEALGVDELGLPTWPGIAACAAARLKRGLGASR